MPNTTNLNIPYPASTDLVSLGYDQIADVATGFDAFWTWTTGYNPTLTQSATLTKTVGISHYATIGNFVIWSFVLNITSAGTAANAIEVGLPVNAAVVGGGAGTILGSGRFWDDSATTNYTVQFTGTTASTARMIADGTAAAAGTRFGVAPAITAANGDIIAGNLIYRKS